MDEDKATARPWRVSTGGWNECNVYLSSEGNGYVPIATPYRADAFTQEEEQSCPEGRERCEAARANAALIVRAVNAHDALVAALAALANVGSDGRCQSCGCDPEPEGYCGCLPLRDAVENERRCAGRRALALARGEE